MTPINKILKSARKNKKDEFYTLYEDVKFECEHYLNQLRDKVIYCPCDNNNSAFVEYFTELKEQNVIKDLIYSSLDSGIDFLSDDAMEYYARSDVVITNPPFSRFREFIDLLIALDKEFIIWGTNMSCTYKEVFPLFVKEKINQGYITKSCEFKTQGLMDKGYKKHDGYFVKVPAICTLTTLEVHKQNTLNLSMKYNPEYHLKYDNYNAINCNRTKDIPIDYNGLIGVPISYLNKHNNTRFKIIGLFANFEKCSDSRICGAMCKAGELRTRGPVLKGEALFQRIIIKKCE